MKFQKTKEKILINGKNKIIYKLDNSAKKYIRHNNKYISITEYKKGGTPPKLKTRIEPEQQHLLNKLNQLIKDENVKELSNTLNLDSSIRIMEEIFTSKLNNDDENDDTPSAKQKLIGIFISIRKLLKEQQQIFAIKTKFYDLYLKYGNQTYLHDIFDLYKKIPKENIIFNILSKEDIAKKNEKYQLFTKLLHEGFANKKLCTNNTTRYFNALRMIRTLETSDILEVYYYTNDDKEILGFLILSLDDTKVFTIEFLCGHSDHKGYGKLLFMKFFEKYNIALLGEYIMKLNPINERIRDLYNSFLKSNYYDDVYLYYGQKEKILRDLSKQITNYRSL